MYPRKQNTAHGRRKWFARGARVGSGAAIVDARRKYYFSLGGLSVSRRRRYREAHPESLGEVIVRLGFGLLLFVGIFLYLQWSFSRPGAFDFAPKTAVPTDIPITPTQTTITIHPLLFFALCAIFGGTFGIIVVGILWLQNRRRFRQSANRPTFNSPTVITPLASPGVAKPQTEDDKDAIEKTVPPTEIAIAESPKPKLGIRARSPLTPAEQAFFHMLKAAVANDYQVLAQVPLKQLVSQHAHLPRDIYGMLENGVVDFILVHPKYLGTVLAIELDDSSHRQAISRSRDQLKEQILDQAHIPLLRFRVGDQWNTRQIRNRIDETVDRKNE